MKVNKKINELVSKLEKTLPTVLKLGIISILGCFAIVGFLMLKSYNDDKITRATVMVKSISGGGGSGVVIKNSVSESLVLTNNHVCEVVKNGGIIVTTSGAKHLISKYSQAQLHDICLISVNADLGTSVSLSNKTPSLYENATISGHPALLPNVVSKGHFGGNQIIQVFMGIKPCTSADMQEEELQSLCMFFGGIPVLKTFDAVLVTATIMAGSSGSAVYDSSSNVAGLVFAGSGELSYAYTVPFSYIYDFLNNEPKQWSNVNYNVDIVQLLRQSQSKIKYFDHIKKKCEKTEDEEIKQYCNVITRDVYFRGSVWK